MSSVASIVQLASKGVSLVQQVFRVERRVAEIFVQGFVPFTLPFVEIEVLEGGAKEGSYNSLTALTLVLGALSVVSADPTVPANRRQENVNRADFLEINQLANASFTNSTWGFDPATNLWGTTYSGCKQGLQEGEVQYLQNRVSESKSGLAKTQTLFALVPQCFGAVASQGLAGTPTESVVNVTGLVESINGTSTKNPSTSPAVEEVLEAETVAIAAQPESTGVETAYVTDPIVSAALTIRDRKAKAILTEPQYQVVLRQAQVVAPVAAEVAANAAAKTIDTLGPSNVAMLLVFVKTLAQAAITATGNLSVQSFLRAETVIAITLLAVLIGLFSKSSEPTQTFNESAANAILDALPTLAAPEGPILEGPSSPVTPETAFSPESIEAATPEALTREERARIRKLNARIQRQQAALNKKTLQLERQAAIRAERAQKQVSPLAPRLTPEMETPEIAPRVSPVTPPIAPSFWPSLTNSFANVYSNPVGTLTQVVAPRTGTTTQGPIQNLVAPRATPENLRPRILQTPSSIFNTPVVENVLAPPASPSTPPQASPSVSEAPAQASVSTTPRITPSRIARQAAQAAQLRAENRAALATAAPAFSLFSPVVSSLTNLLFGSVPQTTSVPAAVVNTVLQAPAAVVNTVLQAPAAVVNTVVQAPAVAAQLPRTVVNAVAQAPRAVAQASAAVVNAIAQAPAAIVPRASPPMLPEGAVLEEPPFKSPRASTSVRARVRKMLRKKRVSKKVTQKSRKATKKSKCASLKKSMKKGRCSPGQVRSPKTGRCVKPSTKKAQCSHMRTGSKKRCLCSKRRM